MAPAQDWKHGHNFIHHTYTNIHGMDRDIGYNLLRIDDDQPWYPNHRFNLPLAFVLMLFFEWGVMYHGIELDEYLGGKMSKAEFQARKKRACSKVRRQVVQGLRRLPARRPARSCRSSAGGPRWRSSARTSSPTSSATSGRS